jgi:hypothetical protein
MSKGIIQSICGTDHCLNGAIKDGAAVHDLARGPEARTKAQSLTVHTGPLVVELGKRIQKARRDRVTW